MCAGWRVCPGWAEWRVWPERVVMLCLPWYSGCVEMWALGAAGCMVWERFWLLEVTVFAATTAAATAVCATGTPFFLKTS